MQQTNCLRCGQNTGGRWFSICPICGRYMATQTISEIVSIYVVNIIVSINRVGHVDGGSLEVRSWGSCMKQSVGQLTQVKEFEFNFDFFGSDLNVS